MLYRPEDFEPLVEKPWDAARVRAGIREIVEDTDAALRGPKLLWPAEAWDRWRATSPLKDVYCGPAACCGRSPTSGTAGMPSRRSISRPLRCAPSNASEKPDLGSWTDLPEPCESALLSGEAGILLVAFRLTRDPALADALLVRVRANVANDANELMWGTPGTLLAARVDARLDGGAALA